jgi:acetylglutamate kinase
MHFGTQNCIVLLQLVSRTLRTHSRTPYSYVLAPSLLLSSRIRYSQRNSPLMKNSHALIVFIIFLDPAVGFGFVGRPTPPTAASSSSWIKGYSVALPRRPSLLRSSILSSRPASLINSTDSPFFNVNELLETPIKVTALACDDPSTIEFISPEECREEHFDNGSQTNGNSIFPFANMITGSARYIADHLDQVAVFYIPGELIEQKSQFSKLMADIALSWMLGLKIVIVVGCRFDVDCCSLGFDHRHECHNSLRITDHELLLEIEQEAGHVRFEVERTLNKHLRMHGGMSPTDKNAPLLNGNVVGGNFYTARAFGVVKGVDYQHSGFASKIHTDRIGQILGTSDIVVLSTVGTSQRGDLVTVNGNHLAACVAASLKARKLVYLATNGCVLRRQGDTNSMQDVTLGTVDALLQHHKVVVNKAGFASFGEAKKKLDAKAVELLLHLGWASWSMTQGVNRAHIVNPGDGALLEELFTSSNGVNTCVYQPTEEDDDMDLNDDEFEGLFDQQLRVSL